MYRLVEILSILALAAASGYVLSRGGYGAATIGFTIAAIFAIGTDTREETMRADGK